MNRWQFLYNLRARLIFLVLLALLPALAIMLYTADETRQQEVVRTRENIHTLTQLVASREVQLIEGARQFLITLAQLQEVREADLAACPTRLADLLIQYPSYRFLGVANLEGEVTCSTASSTEPVNVAVRPWFQQALESRNFAVGDYQVGRTSGVGILIFGYPVLDEANQPQAVVFAVREVNTFSLAEEILLPNKATSFGLQIMRERVESVGGSLEIDTAPGQGTRIILSFNDMPDQ